MCLLCKESDKTVLLPKINPGLSYHISKNASVYNRMIKVTIVGVSSFIMLFEHFHEKTFIMQI